MDEQSFKKCNKVMPMNNSGAGIDVPHTITPSHQRILNYATNTTVLSLISITQNMQIIQNLHQHRQYESMEMMSTTQPIPHENTDTNNALAGLNQTVVSQAVANYSTQEFSSNLLSTNNPGKTFIINLLDLFAATNTI